MKLVNREETNYRRVLSFLHSLSRAPSHRVTDSLTHRRTWSTVHGLAPPLLRSPPSLSPPLLPSAPRASSRALRRPLPAATSPRSRTTCWRRSRRRSTSRASARRRRCAARGAKRCGRCGRRWCCSGGGSASSTEAAASPGTPTRLSTLSWKPPRAAPHSPWSTPDSFIGREGTNLRPWNCILGLRNLETLLLSAIWEFRICKVFITLISCFKL